MSFNTKTVAASAAALLAAAGGLYAFIPNQETAPNRVSPTQTVAAAKPESPQAVANGPNVAEADAKGAEATVAVQPVAPAQPASQAPKKLTRAQLTPPSATEEEKLQKAAEQESNF